MNRRFPRLFRRLAWLLLLSVFTSDLALAAYVCPALDAPQMAVQMLVNGQPCTDMDPEQPVQCAQFQSGSQLALEHLAAAPALAPVLVAFAHPAPLAIAPAGPVRESTRRLVGSGIDPPYLCTQRLRI